MLKTAIVCLTQHWRIEDHPLLIDAGQLDRLLLVFPYDNPLIPDFPIEIRRKGSFRLKFIGECLRNFDHSLQSFNQQIWVASGTTIDVMSRLLREIPGSVAWLSDEPTWEKQLDCQHLTNLFGRIRIHTLDAGSMFQPESEVLNPTNCPEVFTSFRKSVEAQLQPKIPVQAPKALPPMPDNIPEGLFCWFEIPELNPQNTLLTESKSTFPWKGGETEAHKRLSYYFFESKSALQYKETRNGLLGSDFSTRFSPFLAHGALSPSIILKKLKEFESMEGANASTYWIYFELLWREYFRVIARKHGPALFYQKGIQNKNLELCHDALVFLQWCNGESGHPFIDACMTELKHTGWLSNRGRQVVASYLVHYKRIDWRWGAWWFEHLLIDYDPASNWGNWQYVAGIGQDPRGTRVFNPDRQAAMYDPDGRYQSLWLKNKR